MKRIISIIFLFLLVMKIGGYFAFLTIQQIIFREEAKEKILHHLPANKLTKLSFSDQEIQAIDWEETNKEFYYEGNLYDVVKIEFEQKNCIIFCLADENETEIYSELQQMSKAQNDEIPVKNTMISFLNLLNLKYTIPSILSFKSNAIIKNKELFIENLVSNHLSIPIFLFFPPPEA